MPTYQAQPLQDVHHIQQQMPPPMPQMQQPIADAEAFSTADTTARSTAEGAALLVGDAVAPSTANAVVCTVSYTATP